MKKLALALAGASVALTGLVATPALAADFGRHNDRSRYEQVQTRKVVQNRRVVRNRVVINNRYQQNHRWQRGQRFDQRYAMNYRVINNPGYYHLRLGPLRLPLGPVGQRCSADRDYQRHHRSDPRQPVLRIASTKAPGFHRPGVFIFSIGAAKEFPMASEPHVLIVDDERDILDPLAAYIGRNGFPGVEGRQRRRGTRDRRRPCNRHRADRIMMPGEDGLSLTRFLRGQADIPVILLTAKGEETDRIVGLEVGADDYVTKPFSPRELVARIEGSADAHGDRDARETDANPFGAGPSTGERERSTPRTSRSRCPAVSTSSLAFVTRPGMVLRRDQLLDLSQGRDRRNLSTARSTTRDQPAPQEDRARPEESGADPHGLGRRLHACRRRAEGLMRPCFAQPRRADGGADRRGAVARSVAELRLSAARAAAVHAGGNRYAGCIGPTSTAAGRGAGCARLSGAVLMIIAGANTASARRHFLEATTTSPLRYRGAAASVARQRRRRRTRCPRRRLTPKAPQRREPCARRRHGQTMLLSVQLADGRWLNGRLSVPCAAARSSRPSSPSAPCCSTSSCWRPRLLIATRIARPLRRLTSAAEAFRGQQRRRSLWSRPAHPTCATRSLAFNAMNARHRRHCSRKRTGRWAPSATTCERRSTSLRIRAETVEPVDESERMIATIEEMTATLEDILVLARSGRSREPLRARRRARALAERSGRRIPARQAARSLSSGRRSPPARRPARPARAARSATWSTMR